MSERFLRGMLIFALVLLSITATGMIGLLRVDIHKVDQTEQNRLDILDLKRQIRVRDARLWEVENQNLIGKMLVYKMLQREDPMNGQEWRNMYNAVSKELERRNASK